MDFFEKIMLTGMIVFISGTITYYTIRHDELEIAVSDKIESYLTDNEIRYKRQVFAKEKRFRERDGYAFCTKTGSVSGCRDFIKSIVELIKLEAKDYYKNQKNLPEDYILKQL